MNDTVSKAEHALSFELMGTRVVPFAAGSDAAAWELFGLRLSPGGASPLHTVAADKVFVVTEGTVRVRVGEQVAELTAGASVQIPAGTPHNYVNTSGAPAAMVALVAGASVTQLDFLRGMSALTADGRPDPDALAEHTARHGVRLLPAT